MDNNTPKETLAKTKHPLWTAKLDKYLFNQDKTEIWLKNSTSGIPNSTIAMLLNQDKYTNILSTLYKRVKPVDE